MEAIKRKHVTIFEDMLVVVVGFVFFFIEVQVVYRRLFLRDGWTKYSNLFASNARFLLKPKKVDSTLIYSYI